MESWPAHVPYHCQTGSGQRTLHRRTDAQLPLKRSTPLLKITLACAKEHTKMTTSAPLHSAAAAQLANLLSRSRTLLLLQPTSQRTRRETQLLCSNSLSPSRTHRAAQSLQRPQEWTSHRESRPTQYPLVRSTPPNTQRLVAAANMKNNMLNPAGQETLSDMNARAPAAASLVSHLRITDSENTDQEGT